MTVKLTNYLQNIKPAMIGGQQFYAKSITGSQGNKLIINELPNGGRIVEFFGKQEGVFTVEGDIESIDYNSFVENVLTQETKYLNIFAELNIPVIVQKINKTQSHSKLGLTSFSIELVQSEISTGILKISNLNVLQDNIKNAKLSNLDKFNNFFRVATSYISTASATINNTLSIVRAITQRINTVQESIEVLNSQISAIEGTITNLILAPAQLSNSIRNLVANFSNTFGSLDDNIKAVIEFTYLSKPSQVEQDSQYLQQTTEPSNVLQTYIVSECIVAYTTLALEKQFEYVYEVEQQINNIKTLQEAVDNFYNKELKQQTQNLLHILTSYMQQQSNLKSKKTLKTQYTISFSLLCYAIYGNLDNLELLKNWNINTANQSFYIQPNTTIIYYE